MRMYGYSSLYRCKEDTNKCAAQIQYNYHFFQCSRRRGYGEGGLLCKQHARLQSDGRHIDIPADGIKEES